MPDIIRCKKGHYYDSSIYKECPHCDSKEELDTDLTIEKRDVAKLALEYLNECLKQAKMDRPQPQEVYMPVNQEKTIGFSISSQKNYFVAGWLVCVEGPDLGHVFNLYYGYNTIGYSRENQICLLEDLEVAKRVHCSIVYEDRGNRFYLLPEQGYATYRNSVKLEKAEEILTGDIIHIGSSEFEFVAFCRGKRKWNRQDLAAFKE